MFDLPRLIVQIVVIVAVSRLLGSLFRRIRQPQVMGEMIGGILLGPSLLGWIAPGVSASLFPPDSLGYLNALSQVGLVLFMFLVGLELQPRLLRERGHTALLTSIASIVAPFLLGTLLALVLYPRFSDDRVTFTNFALFIGAALSITAFPVLARILSERNLVESRVGAISLVCAALNDAAGWVILAAVVLLVRSAATPAVLVRMGAGIMAYALAMVFVVRRLLRPLEPMAVRRGGVTPGVLALVLVLALASAWTTETMGLHALFGAFAMGAIMPKGEAFVRGISQKLHDMTVVLLLPLFFAFVGLRTSISLVRGAEMWMYSLGIVAVAIAGKVGGSAIVARLTGMEPRQAWTIGILMNTRGLMELVLLNIGLELGVVSPTLFTMMVLMALITTFMTAPLLEFVYFRQPSWLGWLRPRASVAVDAKDSQIVELPPTA
ncbi:MAG: cation:proton antiporter [Anaerolineales bacterium]